jgi:hypothetical protein
MSVSLKASNGVGYNYTHTVTTAEQSAGYVIFDFNSLYTVVAQITLKSSANAVVTNVGGIITYPAAGQVKFANGGSVSLTAGQIIDIVGGIIGTAI